MPFADGQLVALEVAEDEVEVEVEVEAAVAVAVGLDVLFHWLRSALFHPSNTLSTARETTHPVALFAKDPPTPPPTAAAITTTATTTTAIQKYRRRNPHIVRGASVTLFSWP